MIYKIIVDKQSRTNPSSEKKEYTIDIEELRVKGDVYDSLVITKDEDYVMRRLSLSELQVLSVLEEPIKQPLPDLNIELFEGDNYIYLLDMTGNKFYAEYIVKNDFTELYVTTNEMNSAINQSASKIELSVNQKLTGYSTTEEMNALIQLLSNQINLELEKKIDGETITGAYLLLKINGDTSEAKLKADKIELSADDILNLIAGNTINLTSKNMTISATNFSVDKNGKITASDGTIGGFSLGQTKFSSDFSGIYNYDTYDLRTSMSTIMNWLYLTDSIKTICDANNDGKVSAADYTKIKNILNGITTNTKNINGTLIINSQDPKHCISILQDGNRVLSLGTGGVNAEIINVENILCGYQTGTDDNTFKGVFINGHTGEIYVADRGLLNSSKITPNEIITPKLQIIDEGYAMYGLTTGHVYKCDWQSDSRLHFYVDVTDVGNVSDKRLKTDIKEVDEDLIKAIGELDYKQFKKDNRNGLVSVGIIAQDLIEILNKYGKNAKDYELLEEFQYKLDDETLYYRIDYEQFLLLRMMAKEQEIKELQEKDKQKDNLIQSLIERIEKLEAK